MRQECYECHLKTIHQLSDRYHASDAKELKDSLLHLLKHNNYSGNPEFATLVQREARHFFKNDNLYAREKYSINEELLLDYAYWKQEVNRSSDPLLMAARLAVVGNIIDFGAHTVKDDVRKQVKDLLRTELKVNDISTLKSRILEAKNILYLGDNCGEIVFDKLLIETMQHPNVCFVVRGEPVLNDVTMDDANQLGMHKVCRVISNGYDAPSTLLEHCSPEFLREYEKADLIISKGQGNFEGLMESGDDRIYYMLIAKCEPIAEMLQVNKNDMLITRFNH